MRHPEAIRQTNGPDWSSLLVLALVASLCILTAGCGRKPPPLPASAPPAKAVYIPVVKPCAVAKVEVTPVTKFVAHDIYEAVQAILADRQNLLADREALVAANTDPCPA